MKHIQFFIIFSILSMESIAQQQNNIWYFGEGAGLDFSSGTPTVLTNSALNSLEGSAIQCDVSGNLLFYTNGGSYGTYAGGIWNQNHQLMANGDLSSTRGCNSSVQSTVIVPFPGNVNKYYVFTTDCQENGLAGGLAVNIVDLSLDGGLGDVAVKDSVIYNGQVNEALCVIPHGNGIDFWLIAHTVSTYDFLVYQITASGIQSPITQSLGWPAFNGTGQMASNIEGNKFAFAVISKAMLFDFNNTTGTLSNYVEISTNSQGLCFSPGCRYLYICYPGESLWQYDLAAANIPASKTSVTGPSGFGFQMQLAPNGKIYLSSSGSSLDVINSPDNPAASAGFQSSGVSLGTGICKFGLPNILTSWYQTCGFNSIKNISEENKHFFSIHPNPNNGSMTIETNLDLFPLKISIYDLSGKVVLSFMQSSKKIDIDGLDNGMYLMEIQNLRGEYLGLEKLILDKN